MKFTKIVGDDSCTQADGVGCDQEIQRSHNHSLSFKVGTKRSIGGYSRLIELYNFERSNKLLDGRFRFCMSGCLRPFSIKSGVNFLRLSAS